MKKSEILLCSLLSNIALYEMSETGTSEDHHFIITAIELADINPT
jgi:hypothetical protein